LFTSNNTQLIYNVLQNSKLFTKDMAIFMDSFTLVCLKQIMVCCMMPDFTILEKYTFTVIDR